jgi:DnaJ family protein B protein 12
MEGNRDEAQRAFKLAQSLQSTDPIKSLKFAKKACALYWSPEAAALVKTLETGEGPSTTTTQNPTATSTATNTSSSSSTATKRSTQPSTPKPSSSSKNSNSEQTPPTYKPAQLELVKKVRRHKITQYYEILELKREADESQVKSAYRKVRSFH